MNKAKIKERILKENKPVYLSAQEYGKLTSNEKKAMREALEEENQDADEYEKNMKKLFPTEFHPKPLKWRNR